MATKRIFKFVLRIAVVVGIIAGIYFGISAINNNKNANLKILEASQTANITTKINQSYGDLVEIAENNSSQKYMVMRCNDITTAMMQYYNHYLNLTCFENSGANGDKSAILLKITALSNAIDETAVRLANTKKITNNEVERKSRFVKTLQSYFEQTKILFEVNELLKDYVYKVNYGVTSTGILFEAQLEMVKDYSKAVFNNVIYGKETATTTNVMLTDDADETGLIKVLRKFLNRSGVAQNNKTDVYFAQDYMTIDKQSLTLFYERTSSTEKRNYYNSKIGENATLGNNLKKVYNYISLTSF